MDYSEFMIFAEYVQNWQNAILQFQRGKGTVQYPHFNGMWNDSTFQGPSNVIVRSCSQFEVWSGSPSAASPPSSPSPPSVLLFGFAGSKKHQLEKHSKLYNELGYQTLYCILPLQHLFHYDVHKIRQVWKNKTWPGANKNHFALQKPQIVTATIRSAVLNIFFCMPFKICPGTVPIGYWTQCQGHGWREWSAMASQTTGLRSINSSPI